jgi:predicted acylesterase/phospholipase RssA
MDGPSLASPDGAPAQEPELPFCDVILKGGITSGVIYPEMISDLAEHYRLRSVGGTSAGAIAAALAVAAEHARATGRSGDGIGYGELRHLPRWLGEQAPGGNGSSLFHLFQPGDRTAKLFRLLVSGLKGEAAGDSAASRAAHSVSVALSNFPLAAVLGALPGFFLLAALWSGGAGSHPIVWGIGFLLALAVTGVGALLATAGAIAANALTVLPRHGFGLCAGFAKDRPAGTPPPLTEWLTEKINRVAGKDWADGPLTFADLWGTRPKTGLGPDHLQLLPDPAERRIDLQMMTTSLTLGRPYRLPFETRIFFFDPDEWRELFPDPVVRWMVEHPGDVGPEDIPAFRDKKLCPLPAPADLPVVVATRMSLSFPILLSAIPLYGVDFSSLENAAVRQHNRAVPAGAPSALPAAAQRCWFSDGGIGSNFPIHFFDRPIPSWPTFGINLRPRRPETHDDRDVYRPHANGGGLSGWWSPITGVPGFVGAILGTMQNWRDNAQMGVPGYRDRIVHIYHSEEEGGMNLNMKPEVIAALSERGREAAREVLGSFAGLIPAPPPPSGRKVETTWANHRWVRLRSALALFEEAVLEIGAAGPSIETLLEEKHCSYPLSAGQQKHARAAIQEISALAERWKRVDEKELLGHKAPRPQPELRIGPQI